MVLCGASLRLQMCDNVGRHLMLIATFRGISENCRRLRQCLLTDVQPYLPRTFAGRRLYKVLRPPLCRLCTFRQGFVHAGEASVPRASSLRRNRQSGAKYLLQNGPMCRTCLPCSHTTLAQSHLTRRRRLQVNQRHPSGCSGSPVYNGSTTRRRPHRTSHRTYGALVGGASQPWSLAW